MNKQEKDDLIAKIMKEVWANEESGKPYSDQWGHYMTDCVINTDTVQEILRKIILGCDEKDGI